MSEFSGNPSRFDTAQLKRSLRELLGLAKGLLADNELSDSEIRFLDEWLEQRYEMTSSFPGNVIHQRIKRVLADDIVTDDERRHLVDTLKLLIEDRLDDLVEQVDLTELWFDEVGLIDFHDARFCLTGNFVFGPLNVCKTAIEQRGGSVSPSMGATEQYLVIGALGVDEWRSGGLGAEIERAMKLRAEGKPVKIISEGSWVTHL